MGSKEAGWGQVSLFVVNLLKIQNLPPLFFSFSPREKPRTPNASLRKLHGYVNDFRLGADARGKTPEAEAGGHIDLEITLARISV